MSRYGVWYQDDDQVWCFDVQGARILIQPRPAYCDRGHWVADVEGLADVDSADSFPRYFMNLERAKDEMTEWLAWKMECQRRRATR